MKDKKFLGFRFQSVGEVSLLSFLGMDIYKRVGSVFSVFGVAFHAT